MTQETTEQTNLTLEEREQALLAREQALAQREKQEALQRGLSARGLPPALTPFLGGGPAVLVGDYWLVNCMQEVLGASQEPERVLRLLQSDSEWQ